MTFAGILNEVVLLNRILGSETRDRKYERDRSQVGKIRLTDFIPHFRSRAQEWTTI